jgi:hypothetical protein
MIVPAQATMLGHLIDLAVSARELSIRENDISKDGTMTCDRAWRGAAAYTHAP